MILPIAYKHIDEFLHLKSLLLCCLFLVSLTSFGQEADSIPARDAIYTSSDSLFVDSLLSRAKNEAWEKLTIGELNLKFALCLKGVPYQGGTLDRLPSEHLVVRMDSLDCVTFVETVIALSFTAKSAKPSFKTFTDKLQSLRYRNGLRKGYASRLHYFCDWIRDNEAKNLLKDITASIGGQSFNKPIDFMSKHRKLYPQLVDDSSYQAIQLVEADLNKASFDYLPKNNLHVLNKSVKDGDIFAITSSISGIDINHVGIACVKGGQTFMVHASSIGKKVELTSKPLADYLMGIKKDTGLMVLRLNE